MRRTTAISLICGAALAGLTLGRAGLAPAAPGWALLAALALTTLAAWRYRRWLVLVAMITALLLGLWRAAAAAADGAVLLNQVGQKLTLTGTVSDDPGYDPRGFMDFHLDHLSQNGRPIPGQVRVRMYQINLHRGYQVSAAGKLKAPYYSGPPELSYPQLTVLSTRQSALEQLRQRFFAGMKTALPEPMASFGLGLLVGVRALIPKYLQDQLALVGLSHLVAVSGYNLTIIVAAAHRLLERFGRGVALAGSLWLIGGFLAVTGASASIVRASLVALLVLLAAFYGRRFQPVALIMFSAALTAAYKPAYLADYGWLLSFLAFFGIMVLAPAIHTRLGHSKPLLVKIFIETASAQLLTLPLLLFGFGQLSFAAPFTNLIELPLVPLAMLTSFIAGLGGMIAPAFAGWFAWPADFLLRFMLWLIDWCAGQPWAGIVVPITLPVMLALYGLILLGTVVVWRAARPSSTEPTHAELGIYKDLHIKKFDSTQA